MLVKLIIGFIEDLPDLVVGPCKVGISEEFDLLKNWFEGMFDDIDKLLEKVAINLGTHTETLLALVGDIESSAAAEDFFKVGHDVADLLVLAAGPI